MGRAKMGNRVQEVKVRAVSDLEKVRESTRTASDGVWLETSRIRSLLKAEGIDPSSIRVSQRILNDNLTDGLCFFFPKGEIEYVLSKQPKEEKSKKK